MTNGIPIKPSPVLSAVSAYRPPRPSTPVDLHLEGNEGPPPPIEVLDAVRRAGPDSVRRYPSQNPLERELADRIGVTADRLLVTAGGDDALERVLRALLCTGREMILPVPTFEMLDRYAALTGGKVVEVPWLDGAYPTSAVLDAVTPNTAVITVVTPNSPTGLVATADDLTALSAAAPQAVLLVDLAYTEFADDDLTARALELPNAVVVRSLSKAWGLAGLRIGFAAGPPQIIEWLRAVGHPYAVSAPSIAIALTHLRTGAPALDQFVARVRDERVRLVDLFQSLGAQATPSQGNFVFARVDDSLWLRDGLAGLGIGIRIFPDNPQLKNCTRITLPGDAESFDRLCHGIQTVLAPEALLFDMDDTLADVSHSYRGATIATAESFGVEVRPEDITAAKAAGNANNDWELTWRLICHQRQEVTLAAVTDRFEALYQGSGTRRGLKETETLLIDRETLTRWATRFKLGVVTGRPKRDADDFLIRHGLSDLFPVVVTMDDGPLKPSPEPMKLALERLRVSRAWMVGDTPDDIRSARAAGVLPLGVIAPADDKTIAREALLQAGAGRVWDRLTDLEEVL